MPGITSSEKVLEVFLKILQIGTLGPMAWIIIEETKIMAIRFSPVGEINLHGKNLALSQSVRKMNFSSKKLEVVSWQAAVISRQAEVASNLASHFSNLVS